MTASTLDTDSLAVLGSLCARLDDLWVITVSMNLAFQLIESHLGGDA